MHQKRIEIRYLSTKENIADVMTKALSEARLSKLMKLLNDILKDLKQECLNN